MNQKKIAFVFPGQGSQSVGMLGDFETHPSVKDTLCQASEVLSLDIPTLIEQGPAELLNTTINTQPVMLACGYAFYQAWLSQGGAAPALMAGHSLGEYTAATVATFFSFEEALKAVRFRAQVMQAEIPVGVGGMAAVLGLNTQVVQDVCSKISTETAVVEAVNLNTPEQTVIAGHLSAIEQASAALKAAGAKRVVSLPVSAPFHSSLLKNAAHQLGEFLNTLSIKTPTIPFVNNVDVQIETDTLKIRDALVRQACSPVRWIETVQFFERYGITDVVECGPGKVLSGLVSKNSAQIRVHSLSTRQHIDDLLLLLAN
jgi:[acyl-carrier-protein] S-malonyltransferase